jgi:TPR repeat protein
MKGRHVHYKGLFRGLLRVGVVVLMAGHASQVMALPLQPNADVEEKSATAQRDEAAAKLDTDTLFTVASILSGQLFLGKSMYEGRESETNYKDAARLYSVAANRGHPKSQYNLAILYLYGRGVAQNTNEALRLFSSAASADLADAQFALGLTYDVGEFVKQDYRQAMHFYVLAVGQGFAPAQHNLALMYIEGRGVEKNLQEAHRLFRLAANQGEIQALTSLGAMYANGQAVKVDYVCSYILSSLAADRGSTVAAENRDFAASMLSKSRLAYARQATENYGLEDSPVCD